MARLFLLLTAFIMSIALNPMVGEADDFQTWIANLRIEAQKQGVSDKIFYAALGDAKPIKRVIELDRSQPEFTLTFDEYLRKIVSKTRARKAAKKLMVHDEILRCLLPGSGSEILQILEVEVQEVQVLRSKESKKGSICPLAPGVQQSSGIKNSGRD